MKRSIIYILIICLLFSGCEGNTIKEYNNDAQANFDALWEILDEKYCYFSAKELDWIGVYNEYQPKIRYCKNQFSLFSLMGKMLDTLQDGHVNLYSAFDVTRCKGWYENYPEDYYSNIIYSNKYISTDPKIAGGFRYSYLNNNEIGYIQYSSFSNGFSSANLHYIDYYFKDTKGIIIDVRNNGGGQLNYSELLASCFFKEKTITGYMKHKTGKGHDDFSDPMPIYTDPSTAPIDWSDKTIVILTNRKCYSATNDFIVRVKHAPNVVVIGGITGGGGGMPLSQELPNGWMIRFSAVPMFDSEMKHTEFGVEPDIEVHISEENIENGEDAIIDKAIEYIYAIHNTDTTN